MQGIKVALVSLTVLVSACSFGPLCPKLPQYSYVKVANRTGQDLQIPVTGSIEVLKIGAENEVQQANVHVEWIRDGDNAGIGKIGTGGRDRRKYSISSTNNCESKDTEYYDHANLTDFVLPGDVSDYLICDNKDFYADLTFFIYPKGTTPTDPVTECYEDVDGSWKAVRQ